MKQYGKNYTKPFKFAKTCSNLLLAPKTLVGYPLGFSLIILSIQNLIGAIINLVLEKNQKKHYTQINGDIALCQKANHWNTMLWGKWGYLGATLTIGPRKQKQTRKNPPNVFCVYVFPSRQLKFLTENAEILTDSGTFIFDNGFT